MSVSNVGMGSNMDMFQAGASQLNNSGTQAAAGGAGDAMANIQQTAAMQMQFQTQMGILQMMIKLNEALAKMFKALGEAIKGLA